MAQDPTGDQRPPNHQRAHTTVCTTCRGRIDTTQWYPIRTEVIDETVRLRPFCCDRCLAVWEVETSTE
ncbi:DUF7576 family protein [Halobaculum marinum]|uniref:DUF7576 family protein n=1 Tax=Halobaculum marinum TaxID=3031996 RepID=UPI003D80EEF6